MVRIEKSEPSSSNSRRNRTDGGESGGSNSSGIERRLLRSRYLAVKNLISGMYVKLLVCFTFMFVCFKLINYFI